MDNTEVQLVRSCQQGRTESFGEIYDRYVKKIYDFIYYITMNREVAEDIEDGIGVGELRRIVGIPDAHLAVGADRGDRGIGDGLPG